MLAFTLNVLDLKRKNDDMNNRKRWESNEILPSGIKKGNQVE